MMTFEALFSLLALLIILPMLAQPDAQCAGDAVYGQRLAQDVASVLAKKGVLEGFAEGTGEYAARLEIEARQDALGTGGAGSFEKDLQEVAALSGRCVEISMGEASAFSCAGGMEGGREEGDVYSVKRIAVLKEEFAQVGVAVWKGRQ